MDLLFCIDDKYVDPFKTTIYSIAMNTDISGVNVYVTQKYELQRSAEIASFLEALGLNYKPIILGKNMFEGAPATKRFPETVYYRLLAHTYLPEDLDKILYVDSDILCINDLSSLFEVDVSEHIFAAANHAPILKLNSTIHNLRVGSANLSEGKYFNSGVLLMNLKAMREHVKPEEIYEYLQGFILRLLMPDQDILNSLYGESILEIENELYNVDMRITKTYQILSYGDLDAQWLIDNSVLLHYCGTDKPWKRTANSSWDILYKHYMRQMQKFCNKL